MIHEVFMCCDAVEIIFKMVYWIPLFLILLQSSFRASYLKWLECFVSLTHLPVAPIYLVLIAWFTQYCV